MSGCFSPFPHGTGSLSVVYGYLGLRGGPREFTPVCSVPALLGNTTQRLFDFVYRAITFYGALFQSASTIKQFGNSVTVLLPRLVGPSTPKWQRQQALTPFWFGLFPLRSPLLRESRLLSFPQGTEMFQFPWSPPPALCVQAGVTPHDGCRVSPFGHPRIRAW